jgi:ABC-type uncharacterized transport system involved in gliding motility auxiliary subunit
MRALSWLAGLVGFLLLVVYGIAFWALGADASLGLDGDAASKVALGVPSWTHGVGAAGALLFGFFLASSWKSLKEAAEDQGTARSTTALFGVALMFAVSVVVNIMGQRWDKRWDLTATKRYTLAEQSVDIAKGLNREIEIVAFFPAGSPEETNFKDLLANYQRESTLLKVEFHDPYGDPLLAEKFKLTSANGTVIFKAGDAEQRLEYDFGEEAFTNALVKVSSDKQHTLCAIGGHDEMNETDDQGPTGMGVVATKLQGQNYTVKRISLVDSPPTPESCEVTLLAGPRTELLALERDRLAQYVAGGGHLVAMIEPMATPELAADLARYGVKVGNDVVIEADPNRQVSGGDPTFVLLTEDSFDIHPVTQKIKGGVLMRTVRSVQKGAEVPGLTAQVLAHASQDSWGETSLTDGQVEARPDDGVDLIGKVPLAVAVEVSDPAALRTTTEAAAPVASTEGAPSLTLAASAGAATAAPAAIAPKAGGKVVVFGDTDFASNQMVLAAVNQDLLLNAVAWMAGEESQISIRANEAGKGKLTLDLVTTFLAAVVSLVAVPGLTIAGAIGTWLVRRRL